MTASRPWWKEPWPWLLMTGPVLAMAGCAATIWLAMGHADRPIVDGVVKQGLMVRQAQAAPAEMRPAVAPPRPAEPSKPSKPMERRP